MDKSVSANRIEIDFEDEASLRDIQSRLDEVEYHIFHYTGHGAYSEQEDKAYLILEGDRGKARQVDNETVVTLLSGYSSLRLVVLSGSQTAKTSGRRTMSDLSTPLLVSGIPAVVAMQYSVSDKSAMDLATKFYTEISNGTAIGHALTSARKCLLLNEVAGNVDFATPVLFSNKHDCLITQKMHTQPETGAFTLKKPPDLKHNTVRSKASALERV